MDQQWESQLINDAEFTANAQLPSVTFDVNNSYVSQQLGQRVGEEVSHFYHPTPPPRNPNGFGRGVDDVLKMQEGTRKAADLIFMGHYEAPRDSWETAGFMIGAPIALSSLAEAGVERLGAEAIKTLYQGGQQLGKGLVQASRLMNRWGVFSRNSTEGKSEIKMLASPRDFYLSKIENPKLYRIIDRLYRPNAKYGTGSTADAVRHELSGNEFLSKNSHVQKAIESRNALSTLIHSNQQLSFVDKQIALLVREDLQNALIEQPWDKVYIGRQGMTP